MKSSDEFPPLMTITQFCERYSWPTKSAIHSYIFRRESNGLKEAFFHVGSRVLVDPKKFFELIKNHSAVSKPKKGSNGRKGKKLKDCKRKRAPDLGTEAQSYL